MSLPHLWIIKRMDVDHARLLGQRHGVRIGIIPRRPVDDEVSTFALNQLLRAQWRGLWHDDGHLEPQLKSRIRHSITGVAA